MGMWLWLVIFSCIVICMIGYWLTVRVEHEQGEQECDEVPKIMEDYPVLLNPIILLYIVFFFVTGIIIFYYWSQAVSS